MRISDWSSDVCSSDLLACGLLSWASYQRLSGRPRLSAWPREASRTGNNSGGMWQAPFGDYDGPWRSHLSEWPAGRLLGRGRTRVTRRRHHRGDSGVGRIRIVQIGRAHVGTPVTNAPLV